MLAAWILVLAVAPASHPAAPSAATERAFDDAAAMAPTGKRQAALDEYRAIYQAAPPDALTPYAMFEAARLDEEAGAPIAALALYRQLAERFPDHRLVRAAQARIAFLSSNLRGGSAALADYQRLVETPGRSGREIGREIAGMTELVERCPACPFVDEATLWIAGRWEQLGVSFMAAAYYDLTIQHAPGQALVGRALDAQASLSLANGELRAAAHSYRALGRMGGEWPAAAASGLQAVLAAWLRRTLVAGAVVYLLLFFGRDLWRLLVLRRRGGTVSWRVPLELKVYLAPAVLLIAVALRSQARTVGIAVTFVALGGALVIGLNGLLLERGPVVGPPARLLRAVALCGAICAVGFLSLACVGLDGALLRTVLYGPE